MKHLLSFCVILSTFCINQSFACIDPPTPVRLSNSTFESESISVDSGGISMENGRIRFDQKKGQWCFADRITNETKCDIRPTVKLVNEQGQIHGIMQLDNKNRTITLYQVKTPLSRSNFEVDKSKAYVRFEDKSDNLEKEFGSDILVTSAFDPQQGTKLGSVTSTHFRLSKGIGNLSKNKPVDLRTAKAITGCGGVKEDEPTPHEPKSEFQVGDSHGGFQRVFSGGK